MDMRTVEKIEYGLASAVRISPDVISDLDVPGRFIAFDTETTGLDPDKDCIVELGAVVFEHGAPTETFQSYVNPEVIIPEEVFALNHITNEMLQVASTEEIIYPEFMRFLGAAAKGETMICGHVAAFDLSFLFQSSCSGRYLYITGSRRIMMLFIRMWMPFTRLYRITGRSVSNTASGPSERNSCRKRAVPNTLFRPGH